MKTYHTYLTFEFEEEETVKNITNHVNMVLEESKVKEGLILVSSLHTISAIFVNDDEEGLVRDTQEFLAGLVPDQKEPYYLHNKSQRDAPAHLKRNMLGRSETISVTEGKLDLVNWEQIFYADFNGRRKKKIGIKIIGE